MTRTHDAPPGLQFATLSGNYEAARQLLRHIPMQTISTYMQLARVLIAITKDQEALRDVFAALNRLDRDSEVLGTTTLIRTGDHPLITRGVASGPKP